MVKIILKNTDLEVSRLCVGGCPLGGHGWGNTNRNELLDTIKCAISNDINFFDTADVYGRGESEKIIGEATYKNRHSVVIASKFGVVLPAIGSSDKTYYNNTKEHILKSIDGSLKRLSTDYIDIYQLHYRDYRTPILEVVETLEQLKKEGKIRYYGLSNLHSNDLNDIEPFKDKFISFQDEFSLANRRNEQAIKEISEKTDMTVMTWGSLGQGILTGKYDRNSVFDSNDRRSRDTYINFHGKNLERNMCILDMLRDIAKSINKDISSVAIRWILDYLKNSIVIAGVKTQKQLLSNAAALGWNLSLENLRILQEISEIKGEL